MNISQVSFAGSRIDNSYAINARNTRNELRRRSGFEDTTDTLQISKKPKTKNPFKTAFALLLAANIAVGAHSCSSTPALTTEVEVEPGTSIVELAERYGVDPIIIKSQNNIDGDIIQTTTTITIPADFETPVEEEINDLQENLFKKNIDNEERKKIEAEISELLELQQIQSEIAVAYTDGDYAYFTITLPNDETATPTQQKYRYGINVEEFKDIFGIKDGVIKKHNDMSFFWDSDETGGFMNYTGNTLSDGETIKVPVSAVNLKYIESLND
ncbi:MAG: hypothetical protein E7Z90_01530 [Cyanobacteria bacterium SIG29]|nr:hypothetical protein [Cyanobacteria bacterium SIG29]